MRNLLVTGGCGFVGSNLIPLLLETGGYRIRVLDNESLGKRSFLGDCDIDFIHGDLRDRDSVRTAVAGMDAVVHLAADTRVMDSIENPEYNFQVNVIGTFNLLMAMREAGVTRLVNASTGGAILGEVEPPVHEGMVPHPIAPYGAAKLAVEGYASAFAGAYGMKAVSLRFSNVYGPRSFHKGSVVAAFFKRILRGQPLIVYGDGSQQRDYVYVDDLCDGIRRGIEGDANGIYQLGTGIPSSINQLIEAMRGTVGDAHPIEVHYEDFRAGEILHTYCDITQARGELGYDPTTSLEEGLKPVWQWFLDNAALYS
ncbi:MAG: NAD-dependent epimerase/dehydratase family protein [Pseudomonadota bacterium]